MNLRRRWPLLLVLLALAGCAWAAWRVHQVGRPIEEAFARIQVGMTRSDAEDALGIQRSDDLREIELEWIRIWGPATSQGAYTFDNGFEVAITYGQDGKVISKTIRRPDWATRLQLAFGL